MKAYCPRCTLHSGDSWSQCEACRRQDEQEESLDDLEERLEARFEEIEGRLAELEHRIGMAPLEGLLHPSALFLDRSGQVEVASPDGKVILVDVMPGATLSFVKRGQLP